MGDAYVALPGGIGTFYEVLNILALKRLDEIPANKPLILIDGYYNAVKGIIDEMLKDGFVEDNIYSLFDFASTPEEAVEIIKMKI
jgi:predicted Rossmann-fold nucleotide-binding protein